MTGFTSNWESRVQDRDLDREPSKPTESRTVSPCAQIFDYAALTQGQILVIGAKLLEAMGRPARPRSEGSQRAKPRREGRRIRIAGARGSRPDAEAEQSRTANLHITAFHFKTSCGFPFIFGDSTPHKRMALSRIPRINCTKKRLGFVDCTRASAGSRSRSTGRSPRRKRAQTRPWRGPSASPLLRARTRAASASEARCCERPSRARLLPKSRPYSDIGRKSGYRMYIVLLAAQAREEASLRPACVLASVCDRQGSPISLSAAHFPTLRVAATCNDELRANQMWQVRFVAICFSKPGFASKSRRIQKCWVADSQSEQDS